MGRKIIAKYLKSIWKQSYNYGNGIVIGDKLLTAVHVLDKSDYFFIGNQKYKVSDAMVNQYDEKRMDGLYLDFAAFGSKEYNHDLELATEFPCIGDELTSYSYKQRVAKMEESSILDQYIQKQMNCIFQKRLSMRL